MKNSYAPLLIVLALSLVGGTALWFYKDVLFPAPEPPVAIELPVAIEPATDMGPQHPMPLAPPDIERELVPLPPLDDSDAYFLLEIATAFGTSIESLLKREAVIDRLVTTVDNLPRGALAEQIRPVGRLGEEFVVDTNGEDAVLLGISSYARYDALVAQLYYADMDAAMDMYQRYYPLFQSSYERLGYPDTYFNDRLVEVIDHLLSTPEPEGPIYLVRPNVLYEFADPDLEELSSGRKLMLRMGPDNAATLKRMLEKFRGRLVTES